MTTARVHSHWIGGRSGYSWSVVCDGELLVSRSTTPEFDAARALLAKGITGKLTLLDGKTGRPRLTLDIEKCARLTVSEESRDGLRIRKYQENPDNSSPAGEDASPGTPPAKEAA